MLMTLWSVKYRPPGHLMQARRTCNAWKVIELAVGQTSASLLTAQQLHNCVVHLKDLEEHSVI